MNKSISILSILVIALATLVDITSTIANIQSVSGIAFPLCSGCAKDLAPGQEAKVPGF